MCLPLHPRHRILQAKRLFSTLPPKSLAIGSRPGRAFPFSFFMAYSHNCILPEMTICKPMNYSRPEAAGPLRRPAQLAGCQRIAKQAVLHCKKGCLGKRNSHFCRPYWPHCKQAPAHPGHECPAPAVSHWSLRRCAHHSLQMRWAHRALHRGSGRCRHARRLTQPRLCRQCSLCTLSARRGPTGAAGCPALCGPGGR